MSRRAVLLLKRGKKGGAADVAGGGGMDARSRDVRAALAAHGIRVELVAKRRRSGLRRAARAAARGGARLVIAAGGTRTVLAAAQGMLGSDAVLGIVPLGATNSVADAIGIPSDVGAACALIASGSVRSMGVGRRAVGRKQRILLLDQMPLGASARVPMGRETQEGEAEQDGWWGGPPKSQPGVPDSSPTAAPTRLTESGPARRAMTLLVAASDPPRGS